MNIKPTTSVNRALSSYQTKGPTAKSDEKPVSNAPSSMSVALSASSQSLYDTDQDIDLAKVQAIRESLANGTLKINAERIADGLLNSAFELMKR